MQSNIKTVVLSDGGNIYASVARTVTHDDMDITRRKMIPPLYPTSDAMYFRAIRSHERSVLDISAEPKTMLAIKLGDEYNDDEVETRNCTGLSITDHSYDGISIVSRGVVKDKRRITDMKPVNADDHKQGTLIAVFPSAVRRAYIAGDPVAGYFRVNGEFIFIHLGLFSEKKVYLDGCGVLDADGNKYIYDPGDPNMIKKEETAPSSGEFYGEYKLTDGNIVADALQRCINEGYNRSVVKVMYEHGAFHIVGDDDLITYINVPAYSDSTASLLGLSGKDSKHLEMMNLEDRRVYIEDGLVSIGECEINKEGYIVTDIPWSNFNESPSYYRQFKVMYLLDTTESSDVQILMA